MSDAITDIGRDSIIKRELVKIHMMEEIFLKKPTKRKARELIVAWETLKTLPRGYWNEVHINSANKRIGIFHDYLHPKKKDAAIKELENIHFFKKWNVFPFYRAVDGHKRLMGASAEDLLRHLAKEKLGQDIAFFAIVEKGKLRLKSLTCRGGEYCPFKRTCFMKKKCPGA